MTAEHPSELAVHVEDAHGRAAWDDIDVRSISLVVGVGSILIFVAIVAVQVIYYRYSANEFVQKVENVPTTSINEVLAEQRNVLSTAGPGADAEKGERRIPIDEAMEAVLTEYRQRQEAGEEQQASADVSGSSGENETGSGVSAEETAASEETATR